MANFYSATLIYLAYCNLTFAALILNVCNEKYTIYTKAY